MNAFNLGEKPQLKWKVQREDMQDISSFGGCLEVYQAFKVTIIEVTTFYITILANNRRGQQTLTFRSYIPNYHIEPTKIMRCLLYTKDLNDIVIELF